MVNFLNEDISQDIIDDFQNIFNEAMKETCQDYSLLSCSVEFVPITSIQYINNQTRGVDAPTDVLSFPMLNLKVGDKVKIKDYPYDIEQSGELSLGDIIICDEIAQNQAQEYGHSFRREVCYLFLHAVLHLLGYDHMTDYDKKIMREKEEKILKNVSPLLVRED